MNLKLFLKFLQMSVYLPYDIKYKIVKACEIDVLRVLYNVCQEFKEIVEIELRCYVCKKSEKDNFKCNCCDRYICRKCEKGDEICNECMGECEDCKKERDNWMQCTDCYKEICSDCCGFICDDCGVRCYNCRKDIYYAYCEECKICTCSECDDYRYSDDCACGKLICGDCANGSECSVNLTSFHKIFYPYL